MSQNTMMLKTLLDIAKDQLQGLSTLENPDFRLEQAEHDKEDGVWEIVVSYLVENTNKRVNTHTPLSPLLSNFQYSRIYKKLKISDSEELIGMYLFNDKE